MHTTEPKNGFLIMRANGWSLGSISRQLGVPKSTLFNWESDPAIHRSINVLKSLQLEKLQEKYIPSFEEELQRLSTCLCRIERALEKQDFEAMRPEFLLRTSLQLRSRLNKLRTDVQPTRTLDTGELPPNPLPGCITRSRTEIIEDGQPEFGAAASAGESRFGVPASARRGSNLTQSKNGDADVLHPKWDENENSSEPKPSAPATSTDQNGTIVPKPTPSRPSSSKIEPALPSLGRERYGDLATPLTNIPVHVDADQIALTAGLDPSLLPASSRPCSPARTIPPPPQKPCAASRAQPERST